MILILSSKQGFQQLSLQHLIVWLQSVEEVKHK